MNIDQIRTSFTEYCSTSAQATLSIIHTLGSIRNNTELFHRVCLVALNAIELLSSTELVKLSTLLAASNMHYFYNFLRLPRQYFTPVNATSIAENKTLESLSDILQDELLEPNNPASDEVRQFAETTLETFLTNIASLNMAYQDVNQFKEALQTHIRSKELKGFDLTTIDLSDLDVPLRKIPPIDQLVIMISACINISVAALFLQSWNLLETAKKAALIGQYPGFQWINKISLETFISGMGTTCCGIKCIESIRKLSQDELTPEARRNAQLNAVYCAAEFAFNGAYFLRCSDCLKINQSTIHCLAIIAKSIGVLEILSRNPTTPIFKI